MFVTKLKLSSAFVLAVLAIVLIVQNTDPVETRLLFITIVMPRAALLAITILIGIATGILLSLGLSGRRARKHRESESKDALDG